MFIYVLRRGGLPTVATGYQLRDEGGYQNVAYLRFFDHHTDMLVIKVPDEAWRMSSKRRSIVE